MKPQWILSPCETINRDLDFQLALAARCIARHRDVRFLVGRFDALRRATRFVERGLWLGKAFDPFFPNADLTHYRTLKKRGFVVMHLDDEGAVFPGTEDNWRTTLLRRLDPSRVDPDDFLFTWGSLQRDIYAEAGFPAAQIRLTGHPRFDMYREDFRPYWDGKVADLRQRYGDFVLLNTNLSVANNALGLHYSFTPRWHYHPDDVEKRKLAIDFWAHSSRILVAFVELVHALSEALPDGAVVLRPHPSEDQDFYRTVTRGLSNVHVIHEGPVTPWLLASRMLIHNGCTTGIEAGILGLPIVNFRPVEDPVHDLYLPNLFGVRCRGREEVVAEARRAFKAEAAPAQPTREPLALRLLENLARPTFDLLLGALDEALARAGETRVDARLLDAQEALADRVGGARDRVRKFFPDREKISANTRVKFYGFSRASVPERLSLLGKLAGVELRPHMYGDSLMSIEAA